MSKWSGFLPKNALVMARKVKAAVPLQQPDQQPAEPLAQQAPQTLLSPNPNPNPKILVFLESSPSAPALEFLTRMMAAIQMTPNDFVVEYGDFPQARAIEVIGMGLSARKAGRLSALRPDGFMLPSLEEIQSVPAQKKSAWEKLQQLQLRLKGVL